MGGFGGAGGDAGAVSVNNSDLIATGSILQTADSKTTLVAATGATGISNTVDYSYAIFAQSIGGVSGGQSSSEAQSKKLSVALAMGGLGNSVTVTNTGELTTNGAQAAAIFAQSVGGGGGRGGSSTTAVNVTPSDLENLDAMANTSSKASEAQSETKIGLAVAAGLGGAGGNGGNVSVENYSKITTKGDSSSGIFAQSVGGGGGSAGSNTNKIAMVTYSFNASLGSASTAGNGGDIAIASGADITTNGQFAFGIFGQSIGGGGVVNIVNSTSAYTTGNADVTANLGASGGSSLLAGKATFGSKDYPLIDWIITKGTGSLGVLAQSIGGGAALSNNVTSATGTVTASATLGATVDNRTASTGGNASAVEIHSNA
jgi:hypothetical protein